MDRSHVEGVAEDEGNLLLLTEVGDPVPTEHALDSNHEILAVGRQSLEQYRRFGSEVLVEDDLVLGVEDAQVHRAGMQVDAAGVSVCMAVETHSFLPRAVEDGRYARLTGFAGGPGEAIMSIISMQRTALRAAADAER